MTCNFCQYVGHFEKFYKSVTIKGQALQTYIDSLQLAVDDVTAEIRAVEVPNFVREIPLLWVKILRSNPIYLSRKILIT